MGKTNDLKEKFKKFEKDEEIKKEIRKYNGFFKDVDNKSKKAFKSLTENAAFMAVTLRELQASMNTNGLITEYQNGDNQWGIKKTPEVDIYNTMVKNYISAMKQLSDFAPKESKKILEDGFEEFVKNK